MFAQEVQILKFENETLMFFRLESSGFPGLTLEERNELKIRMETEFRHVFAKYLSDKCFP